MKSKIFESVFVPGKAKSAVAISASILLLGLLSFAGITGCKKDNLPQPLHVEPSSNPTPSNSITSRSDEGKEGTKTVLGRLRENPFAVEKMALAHNNLYGSFLTQMASTHLYVKFRPSSLDDITLLEESDLFFFDFPLEYEVVEMGDHYQEFEGENFPELYTVVKSDFQFPPLEYEVIANLYLDKSDPLLIAESFRLTGNLSELQDQIPLTGLKPEEMGGGVQALIPQEPECPTGCIAVLQINTGTIPVSFTWICNCNPPPPPPPPPPITNACGCPKFPSNRKPAGCVKVEDTELSTAGVPSTFEPVRRVKITAWDGWFDLDYAETDDNGCWKINDEYHGNAWFWLKFKNNRCKIRGVGNSVQNAWRWLTTMTDYVGKFAGPNFSNIEVNYNMWTANGSDEHRHWGAATVNNALHEFHDFAAVDGIHPPPNGLDVYVAKERRRGNAFMPNFMGNQLAEWAILNGWTGSWANNAELQLFASLLLYFGPADVVIYFWPDVTVGINYTNSDELKSLAYHEFAHASHYTKVGASYWSNLVAAEVAAGGHGNQNSNDAARISVVESWADYIGGHVYTHRTYGPITSIGGTWIQLLEETWNENPSHIPVGLYHDLVDVGEIGTACNQDASGCTIIPDAVSGFTNAQMFSCLTSSTTSITGFRNCLNTNFTVSTGNTVAAVNALFASY